MIYIVLFLSSFTLTYLIKNYALKKSLLAEVNERSSHDIPTPYGGGIAVSITWFGGIIYLFANSLMEDRLFYALMCGVFLSIVSFLDDMYDISAKKRLIVQFAVAFLALYILGGLKEMNLVFFTIKYQPITYLFSLFLTVWFINLYNFLDGIDGYAGSEALFLSLAGFLLFKESVFLVLFCSVAGFLVWNWHKAKIFMGDSGSTLLGFNVAVFAIYFSNQNASNLWIWLILFGLFWFDATLTLYRRYKNKEKLSKAHKKHAYQRAVQAGYTHDKVVISSIIINIFLFFLSLVAFKYEVLSLPMLLVAIIILYLTVRFIDSKKRFL